MNKIDKFLEMMVQRKVERAVLMSGKPYQIWVEGRKTEGVVLPFEQLRQILLEIAPSSQQTQATQGGAFHFCYPSPYGSFDIGAETFFESIQLTIAPARAVEVQQKSMPLQPMAQPVAPLVPQYANPPVVMQVFCQRCGTANAREATFCSSCGQPINLSTPMTPNNVVYPQATNPTMPMQNIVNVSVQQKGSSSGWIAALFIMMFATPLGCIMIPMAVLMILAFVSIGLWLMPSIIGVATAAFVWNHKAIEKDKKMPIVGGILAVAGVIQLAMFFSYSNSVRQPIVSPETTTALKPL